MDSNCGACKIADDDEHRRQRRLWAGVKAREEIRRADLAIRLSLAVALRHSSNGSVVRCFASKGTNLLRSSSALVMLPSLLSSMYARDTAAPASYCRYSFVLRKREALLRCRPIDRKWRRRKSCAADYYCSCQNYLAHVRLSLERDPRTLSSERKMNPQWTSGHAGILSWGCRDSSASPACGGHSRASPMKTWCFSTGPSNLR